MLGGQGVGFGRITRYAEAILTSELGDWIVSQLPTILGLAGPSAPDIELTATRGPQNTSFSASCAERGPPIW
jgi:hypothetical protein